MIKPKVLLNHLGFLCKARKKVVVEMCDHRVFEIQDMGISEVESLDGHENWKTVMTGELKPLKTAMGEYLVGDFSELEKPGIYRIVLPGVAAHSFQFWINDGVFSQLPRLFLDFVHDRRSGDFENSFRGPSHLDDAVRSDTGEQIDCVGGWYDAGDLRKWMSMTMLPALGFLDMYEKQELKWNHFANEDISDNDFITETVWGIKFILKMQDPETGMIYEEIGGGGSARRKPGMNWWYENHSGCYADNSENRFTDNIRNSGDERSVRIQYNPIVQYTNLTILLKAAQSVEKYDKPLAERCRSAASKTWEYVQNQKPSDKKHSWTSVVSWQLCAGLEMYRNGLLPAKEVEVFARELLDLFSSEFGFWFMTAARKDAYRGILHSAQPIIGLVRALEYCPDLSMLEEIEEVLQVCWNKYIKPMSETNPFGVMPYGLFLQKATDKDLYRNFHGNLKFRFFMPDNSPQQINHGLGGHWTSWSHALSMLGNLFEDQEMKAVAWDQIYWLLGGNVKNSCVISGVGYNNPMPHSRFFGTLIGGFCVGPIGNLQDETVLDLDARAAWNSTEYWNPPVGNSLMALSLLLPKTISREHKF